MDTGADAFGAPSWIGRGVAPIPRCTNAMMALSTSAQDLTCFSLTSRTGLPRNERRCSTFEVVSSMWGVVLAEWPYIFSNVGWTS